MTQYTIRRGVDARHWFRREEPVLSAELAVDIASGAQPWGYSPVVWVDDGVQDFVAVEITEILDVEGNVLLRYEDGRFYDDEGAQIDAENAVAHLEGQPLEEGPEWKRLLAVEAAARALIANHDKSRVAQPHEPVWYREYLDALRREARAMIETPLNGAPEPDALAAMVAALPYLLSVKGQLLANGWASTTISCPWCHAETCQVGIEPRRQHLRVHCTTCNRSLLE